MVKKVFKAILALSLLLGAIEASRIPLKNGHKPFSIKDAIAQPKQEPVPVAIEDAKKTAEPERVFVINGDSLIPPKQGKVIIANKTSNLSPKDEHLRHEIQPKTARELKANENATTSRNNGRIINGFPTDISFYPFVVSIKSYVDNGLIVCTGSLISSKIVLTAAHCVRDLPNIEVCGGSNLYQTGNCRWFAGYIYLVDIDIATIILQDHLSGDNIWPIEMDYNFVYPDNWIQYVGFGGSPDRVLSVANFQVEPLERCWKEDLTCYRDRGNWQFIQGGDSGGPLTFNGRLIGVCSVTMFLNGEYFNDGAVRLSNPVVGYFINDIIRNYG